jgi:hypothetical protein
MNPLVGVVAEDGGWCCDDVPAGAVIPVAGEGVVALNTLLCPTVEVVFITGDAIVAEVEAAEVGRAAPCSEWMCCWC